MKTLNRNDIRRLIKEALLLENKTDITFFPGSFGDDGMEFTGKVRKYIKSDEKIRNIVKNPKFEIEDMVKQILPLVGKKFKREFDRTNDSTRYTRHQNLRTYIEEFATEARAHSSLYGEKDLKKEKEAVEEKAYKSYVGKINKKEKESAGAKAKDKEERLAAFKKKQAAELEAAPDPFAEDESKKISKEEAIKAVVGGKSDAAPIIFVIEDKSGGIQSWGSYKLEGGKYFYVQQKNYKGLTSLWKPMRGTGGNKGIARIQNKTYKGQKPDVDYSKRIHPVAAFVEEERREGFKPSGKAYINPGLYYENGKFVKEPGYELDSATLKYVGEYNPYERPGRSRKAPVDESLSRGSLYRKRYRRY